jgi:hypothetical protein
MIKLQEPKYVYMGGGLRLWKEATLHVGCEAVTRSLNVFEGLKGYWKSDGPATMPEGDWRSSLSRRSRLAEAQACIVPRRCAEPLAEFCRDHLLLKWAIKKHAL